jgi:hypothetical protein
MRVAGRVPSRAISLRALQEEREGLFVLGARLGADSAVVAGREGPVNDALAGFPREGQPLDGIEPRMVDDGSGGDSVAGDGIYTIRIPGVPLGTTMVWKAFAPFSARFRERNPADGAAAFADALPGSSVYGDGQEYPGNENGAVILDEGPVAGEVHVQCLFGDEVTYKKNSGGPAFFWVTGGS